MYSDENYVYKKEVDWSLLHDGLTLPIKNQVVFSHNMGRFLKRGESKQITLYLNGKGYEASVKNVNFDSKFNRKTDIIQIRYSPNGDFAQALRGCFVNSYNYIKNIRELRPKSDRSMIRLPDGLKEYLAIYTTEYEDSFIVETIESEDTILLKEIAKNHPELALEESFNYDAKDNESTIFTDEKLIKIRKLNKKIGDNLKLFYGYRCQICGKLIGESYGTQIVEAHHIDYFVSSLNNDSDNLLIVCPNHHRIIHDVNPIFDKKKLVYKYPNGLIEGLKINKHINIS